MDDDTKKEEIWQAHAQAMLAVSQHLTDEQTTEVKNYLVNWRRDYVRKLDTAKDFQQIASILLNGKIIEYGEYKHLKVMFVRLGRNDLHDMLEGAENQIISIRA